MSHLAKLSVNYLKIKTLAGCLLKVMDWSVRKNFYKRLKKNLAVLPKKNVNLSVNYLTIRINAGLSQKDIIYAKLSKINFSKQPELNSDVLTGNPAELFVQRQK